MNKVKRVKLGERVALADLRKAAAAQGYCVALDNYWGVAEEVKAAEAGAIKVAAYADEDHGALEVYALDEKGGGVMIGRILDRNLVLVIQPKRKAQI